ncbi:Heat stress transcription factor A-1a [Phytophthora nicotianae]|uniref:Heat stress transcription factor A-1a n=5 Tax=Phytophthora nicotianae TaxID=4792 RepID=A0A0W8CPY1_PHYNI|nr:Heat stress transcription factor A-1a [Phytophthora nicotianae]
MEDLYGDLDTSTNALEKKEALDIKTKVEKENKRLRDELAQLQEQNRQLGAANKQLENSISTLFATAQLELGRKDKEIKRLRNCSREKVERTFSPATLVMGVGLKNYCMIYAQETVTRAVLAGLSCCPSSSATIVAELKAVQRIKPQSTPTCQCGLIEFKHTLKHVLCQNANAMRVLGEFPDSSMVASTAEPLKSNQSNVNMNLDINTATDVPRFVRAVYDMLQNEDQCILSWSADGSHFQVYDVPRLESEVLRKYFKHAKFSSFQRQLNNFGFHKWTKTRASVATFSHDVLVRCHPSQLIVLLSDVTVASCVDPLWLLEDICSNKDDLVLLDALDSVELEELDWDAVISPVDVSSNDSDTNSDIRINNVDVDLDFCFELDGAAPTDVLTDADVSVILGDLEITQVILDCEFDVRLEDVAIISTDVDTPLFV